MKYKNLLLATAFALGTLGLQGCSEEQGPFERAGESIDEAAEDTAEFGRDTADAAGDAVRDAGDALEDACEDATNSDCDP